MNRILKKIWANKWVLRNIFQTIYFNLHYLPLKQAIHLPIWLYKPHWGELKGAIEISAPIKTGMIRLGFNNVGIYPNNGIRISNKGKIIFKGSALIGNDSYLHVDKGGDVEFGDNFRATTTLRLASYNKITFGDNVRFGWDCIVMDTDFHKLTRKDGTTTKGYGPIQIGSNNWFGNGCRIMKNTSTPDYCTIAAGTWLSKSVEVPEYSVIGNKKEIGIIASGVYLDPNDCDINYE